VRKGRVTALLELGTGFNPEFTGLENIYLNGMLIGMNKKEINKKLKSIIEFSELGDFIYEPLKTYSSGMTMRLAFSIAIHAEPQILIVDEALSVGDAHFSAKCTRALRDLKKKDLSIIYVSHDLNSLKLLCDRLILLNNGEIIEEGEPEKVINKYNFFIAKLNDKENKLEIKNPQKNSFGIFDVEIKSVSIKGEESNSNVISSGETAIIETKIFSKIDIDNMTVGIRIKDKYGQDIFGTNTYHYDMKISFKKNKEYVCLFKMPLNIGVGKYSISMAIHTNDTHLEHCSHFIENACDFEIAGIKGNLFIGLCRLTPLIVIKEL
jgi:lipopolysaccharide transport system ATP-binding protein